MFTLNEAAIKKYGIVEMSPEDGDAPPCDRKIYWEGTQIIMLAGIPTKTLEPIIRDIAKRTETQTDWNMTAGRAAILTLSTKKEQVESILSAIKEFLLPNPDGKVQTDMNW